MPDTDPGWGARAGKLTYTPAPSQAAAIGKRQCEQEDPRVQVRLGTPYLTWPVAVGLDFYFGLNDGRLSQQLREELQTWVDTYQDEYDETGWHSDRARVAREAEGEVLQRKLQEELGDEYRVELKRFG